MIDINWFNKWIFDEMWSKSSSWEHPVAVNIKEHFVNMTFSLIAFSTNFLPSYKSSVDNFIWRVFDWANKNIKATEWLATKCNCLFSMAFTSRKRVVHFVPLEMIEVYDYSFRRLWISPPISWASAFFFLP